MRVSFQQQQDSSSALHVDNVSCGEVIHQRCLLIKGRSTSFEKFGDYVSVTVKDDFDSTSSPQTWPMSKGHFKALVLLHPGANTVQLQRHSNATAKESTTITVTYVPLLQAPPLHCAIMIAKDSPLLIDCPPYKTRGISSAHSSLDAAVVKFRTTAYMWQALTAEDMRMKGLGRRSFRLDEEYGLDTMSRTSINSAGQRDTSKNMGLVAKIHLVPSKKTTAELRDPNVAQQNKNAEKIDDLHNYFEEALAAYGGVFDASNRPIVAGMILDSHYSVSDNLLLGHGAIGCHNPKGLSLGMFGSHLTYSWPRFFEEIPACLTDTTPPGDTVCNDNDECGTLWEACSVGQGAFLHEVGHAFGADHTTGIMARGYAQDWPKNFLAQTAYCAKTKADGVTVVDGETTNNACWDLKDALLFSCFPHFRMPGDKVISEELRESVPSIRPLIENGEVRALVIECKAGIAAVSFQNGETSRIELPQTIKLEAAQDTRLEYPLEKFDQSEPLDLMVLGRNGKERRLANAWKSLLKLDFIRIPNSDINLHKTSVRGTGAQDQDESMKDDDDAIQWATMLSEKGEYSFVSRVSSIDLRVGCIFDGGVMRYKDGHTSPWGPRYNRNGGEHRFGGHASQTLSIPPDAEIKKVQINRSGWGGGVLGGIRVWLSTGQVAGALNARHGNYGDNDDQDEDEEDEDRGEDDDDNVVTLKAADGEKIVGFFGQSQPGSGYCTEFGIITADKDTELPLQTYDMPELQNRTGRALFNVTPLLKFGRDLSTAKIYLLEYWLGLIMMLGACFIALKIVEQE